MKKAYRLLGILQEYAPNAEAQQLCATLHNEAYLDGNSEEYVERLMVYFLSDGLQYGNWPWTNKT